MIIELFQSLFTSCPFSVRKMGYLTELIAIGARYKRQDIYWSSHLRNSKHYILKEAKKSEKKDIINVIGAGILLDIPLDELAKEFKTVNLIDIVFLPILKKKIRYYNNVNCIQCDVSGVVEEVYKNKKECSPQIVNLPKADVTVSANLLSQLPLLPMEYLNSENNNWGKEIIEKHIELIKRCSPLSILICETNQLYKDKSSHTLEDNDMMLGAVLPAPQDEWTWQIAPLGEASKDYSIEGTVKAFTFHQTHILG